MGWLQLDFIDSRIEVEGPAEELFDFFLQVERWPSWASGVRRAFRKSNEPWGVGSRFGFVPAFLPLPISTRVLSYRKGRLVEWGVRSRAASVVHRFEFEPAAGGRTAVRQVEFARGVAALLLRPLRRRIHDFDQAMLEDLRKVRERSR